MRLSLRGQNLSIELGGFTPLRGASHFLLLVQNKVTKENTPHATAACGGSLWCSAKRAGA
jgi:hypothetical protein